MKLRSTLTLMLLVCGLVPLVVGVTFNFMLAHNNSRQMEEKSRKHLLSNAEHYLTAVQHAKGEQVVSLMNGISDQAVAFSKNPATIEACLDFSKSFGQADYIRNATSDQMKIVDQTLLDYYQQQFGKNYRQQNDGKSVDAAGLLAQLDPAGKLMQYEYIATNPHPLGEKDKLNAPDSLNASDYNQHHEKYHPAFRDYLNRFGYYDIFLCDRKGRIVYSVFKELDYGTSLLEGPYQETNLSAVFRRTVNLNDDQHALSDFQPYKPSYEAPACFTGSPIYHNGQLVGAAIFQIPVAKINQVMTDRAGLGEAGESYLVGQDGIMRSDSFLDPANRSLSNAFRHPDNAKVNSEAARRAIAGEDGFLADTTNYLGHPVLSRYGQLQISGLKWGIVTDMPAQEALASVYQMSAATQQANFWFLVCNGIGIAVVALLVSGLAYFLSGKLVDPILQVQQVTRAVADGNLSTRLKLERRDELGDMARSLNAALDRLCDSIGRISQSARTLNSASRSMTSGAASLSTDASNSRQQSQHVAESATELSHTIQGMSSSAEQMTSSMRTVAASVEEMTQTIAEIASNAERSAAVAKEASQLATVSNSQIADLGSAADEIGKVIQVIQDIAEQTNLLALNATIEAARAGEAGKGFAVVATEVKELAKQTGAATDDIRQRIEGIQQSTGKAIASIREISEVVEKVNMVASTIASAVEEQNVTTREMARHIGETAQSAEGVSTAVVNTSRSTKDIASGISEVELVIGRTADSANGSQHQGQQLLAMAEEMLQLVGQFQIDARPSAKAGARTP